MKVEVEKSVLDQVLGVYDEMAMDCDADLVDFVYSKYNKSNYDKLKKQAGLK